MIFLLKIDFAVLVEFYCRTNKEMSIEILSLSRFKGFFLLSCPCLFFICVWSRT